MSNGRQSTRSRTVTWDDPLVAAGALTGMSGLAQLRAIATGELPEPPIIRLLGFSILEIEEGKVVFGVTPAEYHYNPIGVVHGGVAATLLDSAMGCAVQSVLPQGTSYTTLEFKVNLVRALTLETGPVRGIGTIIHLGGRIATAEGRVVDAQDRLYAHAVTTCMIFRPGGR